MMRMSTAKSTRITATEAMREPSWTIQIQTELSRMDASAQGRNCACRGERRATPKSCQIA